MKVYEISVKVYLVNNLILEKLPEVLSQSIDKTLGRSEKFLELHNKNCYKNYCFNSLYPLEEDKIYKEDNIYTFQIRTIDYELAIFLEGNLRDTITNDLKILKVEIKIIKQKYLEKIYSITPIILKDSKGYWKNNFSLEDYEQRLRSNLFKKYKDFTGKDIDESAPIFNSIEFKNLKPIGFKYKGISLLGDKVSLIIASDEISQKVAYMMLGTGIGEMGARSAGFVNFRYL